MRFLSPPQSKLSAVVAILFLSQLDKKSAVVTAGRWFLLWDNTSIQTATCLLQVARN
jgi:hypothetical protein